jgi:hypothetical protein
LPYLAKLGPLSAHSVRAVAFAVVAAFAVAVAVALAVALALALALALVFLVVIPEGNLLLLLLLHLQSPLLLQLPVLRCHPERSEGPPYPAPPQQKTPAK